MQTTQQIFELLSQQPILSISLGFVLAGFLAWVFRGVIVEIVRKKFGLYTEDEVFRLLQKEVGTARAITRIKKSKVNEKQN